MAYKVTITEAQLNSIINMAADMEAMLGNGEDGPDRIWLRHIRNTKSFLRKNGFIKHPTKAFPLPVKRVRGYNDETHER